MDSLALPDGLPDDFPDVVSDAAELRVRHRRTLGRLVALLALVMIVAAIIGWYWTGRAATNQLEQVRASEAEIVKGRLATLSAYLDDRLKSLVTLANNPGAQLYVSTPHGAPTEGEVAAGQAGYMHNLLLAVAERDGWLIGASGVGANLPSGDHAGLALLSTKGDVLLQVGGPVPTGLDLTTRQPTKPLIDGGGQVAGAAALRLLVPITGVTGGSVPAAYVYGVRPVDDQIARLLRQPGEAEGTAEQMLVATTPSGYVMVTSRPGVPVGTPVAASLKLDRALTSHQTIEAVDGDRPVMLTARMINGTNWSYVRLRSAHQVQGTLGALRWLSFASWMLTIGLLGLLLLFAWRQRTTAAAEKLAQKETTARLFFHMVADRQPTATIVLRPDGSVRFANSMAKRWAGESDSSGDILGLAEILARAEQTARGQLAALAKGEVTTPQLCDAGARIVRLESCLLDPANSRGDRLLVAEDLTALIRERERREGNLAALVRTLAGLVDARDPGSAHHSEKVSQVSAGLSQALGWKDADIRTLRTAGLLLNIGKILVPAHILTKQGPLTVEEHAQIRTAINQTSALLAHVPFDGPVAAAIAGVTGNTGGDAHRLSQLLRIVNMFVSLVSPRAHRPALDAAAAFDELRRSGKDTDHAIITALAHWFENQGGRAVLGLN